MSVSQQDYYNALQRNLTSYRNWAWKVSPRFGAEVDKLMTKGAAFGDGDVTASPDTLDAILNSFVSGIKSAATSIGTADQNYYAAITAANNVQAASKAGLTLDQYNAATQGGKLVSAATSVPNKTSLNSAVLGLPVWIWFAAGGFFLIASDKRRH